LPRRSSVWKEVTPEMNSRESKPSLFVGSSHEGLEVARAVRFHLSDVADVELWNDGSIVSLSYGILDGLVQALNRFDFGVFVLTPDDIVISRGAEQPTARDNVLIELGLFMGKLGRDRTFLLCCNDESIKIPSDLAGITFAKYSRPTDSERLNPAVGLACDQMRNAIVKQGKAVQLQTLENHLVSQGERISSQETMLQKQQEIINQLVIYSMSASIYYHLWFISETEEYRYRDEDWFQREMYFLRDNGYIQPIGRGFLTFDRELHDKNLVEVSKLTPVGEFYVQMRGTPPEVAQMIAEKKPIKWKAGKQPTISR
jgi:hypothetical protein